MRMIQQMQYYNLKKIPDKFSRFIETDAVKIRGFNKCLSDMKRQGKPIVQLIAYCLMPTHMHAVLKQLQDKGISVFMGNVLNSYTRYFNTKYRRKGPLWEGRFKNVRVISDEQLLHLTRYVHLNPVTARLVDDPKDWAASSYNEYVSKVKDEERVCEYDGILDFGGKEQYRKFVIERIDYQRELALLKESLDISQNVHPRGVQRGVRR